LGSTEGQKPFKAIVFFNTMLEIEMAQTVLNDVLRQQSNIPVLSIHSQLTQNQRTQNANVFRNMKSAILIGTDVVARGLDFPSVTHVIQVGLPRPPIRESYIHRIGRTARAGKEGIGWIFVTDGEARAASRDLRGLPLKRDDSLETAAVDMASDYDLSAQGKAVLDKVKAAYKRVGRETFAKVYSAYLTNVAPGLSKTEAVERVNRLAKLGWGMSSTPPIPAARASKLGLSGVPGLVIGNSMFDDRAGDSGFGGGRGGYRSNRSYGGTFDRRSPGGYGGGRFGASRPDPFSDSSGRGDSFGKQRW